MEGIYNTRRPREGSGRGKGGMDQGDYRGIFSITLTGTSRQTAGRAAERNFEMAIEDLKDVLSGVTTAAVEVNQKATLYRECQTMRAFELLIEARMVYQSALVTAISKLAGELEGEERVIRTVLYAKLFRNEGETWD